MRYRRAFNLYRVGVADLEHFSITVEGGWHHGYILKALDVLLQIAQFRVGKFDEGRASRWVRLPDHLNRTLLRKRQGAQQDGIDQRKHCDTHSNSERQNPNRRKISAFVPE